MKVQFKHLRGSRAGEVQTLSSRLIRIGRHPSCDVAFDPVHDNLASKFHAEVHLEGREFVLVDKQSKNGTFVNGERVERTALKEGDVLEFGPGGPKLRFSADIGSKTMMAMFHDAVLRSRSSQATGFGRMTVFMKDVVNQAVRESSRKFKIALLAVSTVAVVVSGLLLVANYQTRQRYEQAMEQLSQEMQRFADLNSVLERARSKRLEIKERLAAESEAVARMEAALRLGQAVDHRELEDARRRHQALAAELSQETEEEAQLRHALSESNRRLTRANETVADLADEKVDWQATLAQAQESLVLVRAPVHVSGRRVFLEACGVVLPPGDLVLTTARIGRALRSPSHRQTGEPAVVFRRRGSQRPYVVKEVVSPGAEEGSPQEWEWPGVSILRLDNARLPARISLAALDELSQVRRGQPVAALGLQGVEILELRPVVRVGWVQAVRSSTVGEDRTVHLIQHSATNVDDVPGTPLFNAAGKLIGINGARGPQAGSPLGDSMRSATYWALRVDALQELLRQPLTASYD